MSKFNDLASKLLKHSSIEGVKIYDDKLVVFASNGIDIEKQSAKYGLVIEPYRDGIRTHKFKSYGKLFKYTIIEKVYEYEDLINDLEKLAEDDSDPETNTSRLIDCLVRYTNSDEVKDVIARIKQY